MPRADEKNYAPWRFLLQKGGAGRLRRFQHAASNSLCMPHFPYESTTCGHAASHKILLDTPFRCAMIEPDCCNAQTGGTAIDTNVLPFSKRNRPPVRHQE
jgi:hypothetical protein